MPLLALTLAVGVPIGIVCASDNDNPPQASSAVTMGTKQSVTTATTIATAPPAAAPPTTAPPTATPKPTIAPAPTKPPSPTDGLTLIAEGGAEFYAPGFDAGGWDAIIRTHISGGQGSAATFPYSPQGYYCVHPDFVFGNILTLQNPDTGTTIRCTVADAVAPWDQPNWRSHCVIEISYALYAALGLDQHNHVTVWAMPH